MIRILLVLLAGGIGFARLPVEHKPIGPRLPDKRRCPGAQL